MDELFEGPWYKGWKAKATRVSVDSSSPEVSDIEDLKSPREAQIQHVEGSEIGLGLKSHS